MVQPGIPETGERENSRGPHQKKASNNPSNRLLIFPHHLLLAHSTRVSARNVRRRNHIRSRVQSGMALRMVTTRTKLLHFGTNNRLEPFPEYPYAFVMFRSGPLSCVCGKGFKGDKSPSLKKKREERTAISDEGVNFSQERL